MTKSSFELDIEGQPDALRSFAESSMPTELGAVLRRPYERIVLTGMGSSHFAALPTWQLLAAEGLPAWWVDAGQLLETTQLITPDTLLIVTSQSGDSGEVTALLDSTAAHVGTTIGITNDPRSYLARRADLVVDLHSGSEATVSTKSYLNTLAAQDQLVSAIVEGHIGGSVLDTAKLVEHFSAGEVVARLAAKAVETDDRRVAFIGNRHHAATALYAGLITKEAAKIPAEGFVGGQFRHGPLELAGVGLTAILFGTYASDSNTSLHQLGADLVASGADVLLVGDLQLDGAETVSIPASDNLAELAGGALVAQHFAVEVAKARGIEPGAFLYGSKVTTEL
jgi:glucosamine--fructose-6-phosphate aminotransferase (isomerizing)